MYIAVVGVGYVGLVTGAAFSDLGNDVVCVDVDQSKIDGLKAGRMPIYEPGLEEIVLRNMEDGRLDFSTDLAAAVVRSDVIFIAVNTPPLPNGKTDLSAVEEVARGIAKHINKYKIIVNKSTVPVGTGDFVRRIIATNKKRNVDFDVVSNPEFLREGSAIADTLQPDRIVIGAPNHQVAMTLLELYAGLERPMLITDVQSAELIKYASNSYLAMRISFINAMADVCEACGADISQVVKGMGYDSRIGPHFLQPGLGYGGSCFPKDTESLIHTAAAFGVNLELLSAVVEINRSRARRFVERMRQVLGTLDGKVVGILGLAFKPQTDDVREAKSLEVIRLLVSSGAQVRAYDPVAIPRARAILPEMNYVDSAYAAVQGADAIALITEWNEFRFLRFDLVRAAMRRPLIFDGRNVYEPERLRKLGFEYHSIGRPAILPPPEIALGVESIDAAALP
ncbi:MAG: UDP-glucose/GDP-mannose dehydrogenase family protein [Candidatus Schekmanbacteria bacterium]|nr:UDP-glucose/GDP-mannose dehydrogenase family protein [Candidatus Schekmanbacteria bacterium]